MRSFLKIFFIVLFCVTVFSSTPFVHAAKKAVKPPTSKPGVNTYVSKKLGVSFVYLASQGEPIIEKENIIYVNGETGQYVKKFKKKAGESLKAAVKRTFLGKAPKYCVVENSHFSVKRRATAVEIVNSKNKGDWDPEMTCAGAYERTNGVSYFWMEKSHPTSFYFFSIGQYSIGADPDDQKKQWQDTFEVLK